MHFVKQIANILKAEQLQFQLECTTQTYILMQMNQTKIIDLSYIEGIKLVPPLMIKAKTNKPTTEF